MNHTHQPWGIVLAAGEGTRVRGFLTALCGGRGIKQFCAVIGRRTLLEHTLTRVQRLIPRERILVIVDSRHRPEAAQQLAHWPEENVIYQPMNRDTTAGILLPLAHISYRDPDAVVGVFPSDHFVLEEKQFMTIVGKAFGETQTFPGRVILLGMTPDRLEEGYGWIEPTNDAVDGKSRPVRGFWEKPSPPDAERLMAQGAFWNTFVFAARASTLWEMVRGTVPDLCHTFDDVRLMLASRHAPLFIEHAYERIRSVNFSSDVLSPLASRLRVLSVPEVGWSDWGSMERILASVKSLGKLDELAARLRHRRIDDPATRKLVARYVGRLPSSRAAYYRAEDRIMAS